MKGIMFNVFESFVAENWGEDFYESVLDATTLETREPFVAPGTYPDGDLLALVATTIEKLDAPLHDALVAFGAFAFDRLVDSHPAFVQQHDSLVSFLQAVDAIIHIEVRKLYPESVTPTVLVDEVDASTATLRYRSDRKLCPVLEGLVKGAAAHFGTELALEKTACTHEGADECTYTLRMGTHGE